ncbi:RNA polymerase sigma24 factor [Actinorhabdospora filicis]|uniref:RNA polymerase sigma24 factor n=1 Tax=Actinorhabdospora filicis TaxID=1785913 RepID=A0A9W6SIL7_9ACTN|nr:DUF6596 domain-containing protein [Actinorhabdospora filicis]GLZ76953.1 RNA polymerase sigma24 factor [Actinorhabdospora filicis]
MNVEVGVNYEAGVSRELVPGVLGALVRRYGHFAEAEDAVQEALLAASRLAAPPEDPRSWLIRVASRRLVDILRADAARREREAVYTRLPAGSVTTSRDESLDLMFLCCHPALTRPAQVALTLRAVGGLTTAEIARCHFVPEATIRQRITRAKAAVKAAGLGARGDADAVREVLYLIFNEGYLSGGGELARVDLTAEAIRLTRMLLAALPADAETAGLLALMLLTDARRPARVDAEGLPVPMEEQDRARWDAGMIAEGTALIDAAITASPPFLHTRLPGPYRLQAAIAALHAAAPTSAATDWRQIAALYRLLEVRTGNPVVTLNRAVAVGHAHGPDAGLALLDGLVLDGLPFQGHPFQGHRLAAVRAHLLELKGDPAAGESYREAARLTTSEPERRFLLGRARNLAGTEPGGTD